MRRGLVLVLALVALAGCGRTQGVADTRRALERAGFGEVDISLRTAAGLAVATVEADGLEAPPADQAAEVVWATLPLRFDQLVVVLGDQTASFSYETLAGQLGPRDPSLDRRQVDEEMVESGLELMLLLSIAGLLSLGAVVGVGLTMVRAARRRRAPRAGPPAGQAEGPTSGLGADSSDGASAVADGPEAIPS
jgi:hypothetical protein